MGWGVHPFQREAKVEGDEDLIIVIRTTQTEYVETCKGVWMECN
jgi:hypothetical protein